MTPPQNGHVFVHAGLVKVMDNPDQLATVIGHEIAHALLRHQALLYSNLRPREYEADKIGLEMAVQAGFDPKEAISFLSKMVGRENSTSSLLFSSHPDKVSRMEMLRQYLPHVNNIYASTPCRPKISDADLIAQAQKQMEIEKIVDDTFQGL
ncbi:uncharacterized protein [Watersipora subatra]|uniref:uncharacterized protein n=1 Tax=Watersipora subatra TaxID=2589382 RepID=UPI00355B632B